MDPEESINSNIENITSLNKFSKIMNQLGYYSKNIIKEFIFIYEKRKFMDHPLFQSDEVNLTFKDIAEWRNRIESETLNYLKKFNIEK